MMLLHRLGLTIPLIQAPMAGIATPSLAASVSNQGALGSIGVGAAAADTAHSMIEAVRAQTAAAFNVNLFTHVRPVADPEREAAWLRWLAPHFASFGITPPAALRSLYTTFDDDPAMLAMLLASVPPVVSFHFGLPAADRLAALRARGIVLIGTATSLDEARACQAAGLDAVVAQGIEAGGHRGVFDPAQPDEGLSTSVLTRLLVRNLAVPVIAAGGIMDGAGIAAALDLGAVAAQLGTAFVACPESAADPAYRTALTGDAANHTRLTTLISGRPARVIANRFSALEERRPPSLPDYPLAYDAGKALHAAAKAQGEHGFGAYWAGQGAALARPMPAADLVRLLQAELAAARPASR